MPKQIIWTVPFLLSSSHWFLFDSEGQAANKWMWMQTQTSNRMRTDEISVYLSVIGDLARIACFLVRFGIEMCLIEKKKIILNWNRNRQIWQWRMMANNTYNIWWQLGKMIRNWQLFRWAGECAQISTRRFPKMTTGIRPMLYICYVCCKCIAERQHMGWNRIDVSRI